MKELQSENKTTVKQIKRGTSGLCGNSRLRGLGSSSDQGGYVIFLGFTFTQLLPIKEYKWLVNECTVLRL